MRTVALFDGEKAIGVAEYADNLDRWDGHNWTCGSTGRHLGIGKLKDGRFYLCRGTQWEGEEDRAVVVTEEEAREAVLRHNPDIHEDIFGEPAPVLSEGSEVEAEA